MTDKNSPIERAERFCSHPSFSDAQQIHAGRDLTYGDLRALIAMALGDGEAIEAAHDKVKGAADRLDEALETRNVDRITIHAEALLGALAGEAVARALAHSDIDQAIRSLDTLGGDRG